MARGRKAVMGDGNPPLKPKHLFASPEELDNRVNTGYERIPQHNPPAFRQIPPSESSKDLNDPSPERREGNFKFSSGV